MSAQLSTNSILISPFNSTTTILKEGRMFLRLITTPDQALQARSIHNVYELRTVQDQRDKAHEARKLPSAVCGVPQISETSSMKQTLLHSLKANTGKNTP